MMISTPARRISLRRKRCAGSTGNSDSPVSKRVSPSIEDVEDATSIGQTTSHVKASFNIKKLKDPITSRLPTTPKNEVFSKDERVLSDGQDGLQQHSPDTPFMSSQLCGTQECEVVWDCNSPGYSKDDLKRMPGGDNNDVAMGSSPVMFIAPAPHRMLFPRSRVRPQTTTSAKDTTAQLDELLNQLSTRGNNATKGKTEVQSSDIKGEIIPHENVCPSTSRKFVSPPSTPPAPNILTESSQPFEVYDTENKDDDAYANSSLANAFEDSLWGEDLNVGVCDISDSSSASDSLSKRKQSIPPVERAHVSSAEVSKNMANMSADVFDDDLFNDSVIRSTQAVEEAMVESDIAPSVSDSVRAPSLSSKVKGIGVNERGKMNFLTGIREATSVSEDEGVVLSQSAVAEYANRVRETKFERSTTGDNSKIINNQKVDYRYDGNRTGSFLHRSEQQNTNIVQKLNRKDINENQMQPKESEYADKAKGNQCPKQVDGRTSPIVGKQRKSPVDMGPGQRKVRSSFLLSSADPVHSKGNDSIQGSSGMFQETAAHKEKTNYSYGSTGAIGVNDRTSVATVVQGSKCHSMAKRPLFTSNNNASDKAQVTKGSFSRSHSTDNVQAITGKQSSFRRVNSSAGVEMSREFEEDDAFFESILSTLPEEENMCENISVQSLPTTSKIVSKSGMSHGMNQQGHTHRAIKSPVEQAQSKSVLSSTNPIMKLGVTNAKPFSSDAKNSMQTVKNIPKQLQTANKDLRGLQPNTAIKGRSLQGENQSVVQDDFGASDMLDDDLFEDDVLTLIEEVESQYGSQQSHGEMSNSQPSRSQQMKCTQDEIARKKEAAQRLREEKQKRRHQSGQYRPVC